MAHPDLVCFARRRMNEQAHRTHELMRRCAHERRVFYVEEPVHSERDARLEVLPGGERLYVVVPHLSGARSLSDSQTIQATLLAAELAARSVERPIVWFSSPSGLTLASGIEASSIVYDIEELSEGPAERSLVGIADVVFTADDALHEARRGLHPNVVHLPSASDEVGWEAAWAEVAATLVGRERRFPSRWPTRDTLSDEEMAEATQPVVCLPP